MAAVAFAGPRPALSGFPGWYASLGVLATAGVLGYFFLPEDAPRRAAMFIALQLAIGAASAVALLWGRVKPPHWGWVVFFALLTRAVAVPSELIFENDVFRYLWDARVLSSGINPFSHPPAADALAHLRDDWVWAQIPYREVSTIYPPVAQALFFASRALFGESVEGLQLVMLSLDLGTVGMLLVLGRRLGAPKAAAAYALHPLAIKEFAQGAHVDAAAVLLFTVGIYLLVRRRSTAVALVFAVASLVKVFPLVTVPVLWRRLGPARAVLVPVLVGVVIGAVWLFGTSPLQGFKVFATYWIFNPSFYDLAVRLLGAVWPPEVAHTWARPVCGVAVLGWALWLARRTDPADDRSVLEGMLLSLFVLLLFSPAANPWYVAWLLPLALLLRHAAVLAWTYTASLSYAYWAHEQDQPWLRALQYAVPLLLLVWSARSSARGADSATQSPRHGS